MTAMQELVVPKSMPNTFAIKLIKIGCLSPVLTQLRCRNSRNDMESLQTKGKIGFYTILKAAKKSAKSVTLAQQERHLAQNYPEGRVPKIRVTGGQICAPRIESLSRAGFSNALAPSMIQVDELSGLANVTDDVELADQFLFRNVKGDTGIPEAFAIGGVF
jgi:hypothetical protein